MISDVRATFIDTQKARNKLLRHGVSIIVENVRGLGMVIVGSDSVRGRSEHFDRGCKSGSVDKIEIVEGKVNSRRDKPAIFLGIVSMVWLRDFLVVTIRIRKEILEDFGSRRSLIFVEATSVFQVLCMVKITNNDAVLFVGKFL